MSLGSNFAFFLWFICLFYLPPPPPLSSVRYIVRPKLLAIFWGWEKKNPKLICCFQFVWVKGSFCFFSFCYPERIQNGEGFVLSFFFFFFFLRNLLGRERLSKLKSLLKIKCLRVSYMAHAGFFVGHCWPYKQNWFRNFGQFRLIDLSYLLNFKIN